MSQQGGLGRAFPVEPSISVTGNCHLGWDSKGHSGGLGGSVVHSHTARGGLGGVLPAQVNSRQRECAVVHPAPARSRAAAQTLLVCYLACQCRHQKEAGSTHTLTRKGAALAVPA